MDTFKRIFIDIGMKQAFFCLLFSIMTLPLLAMDQAMLTLWTTDQKDLTTQNKSIEAKDYSINFIWINGESDNDRVYLVPGGYDKFEKQIFQPVKEWVALNDGVQINIWYDSNTTQAVNIERAKDTFRLAHLKNISFKDLQSLNSIKNNPDIFKSEKLSVYFRADLLRLIVLYELAMQDDPFKYVVYSDLNVPAIGLMPNEKNKLLFDNRTHRILSIYGLVLSGNESIQIYENAFYIVDSGNKTMLQSLKDVLIDPNIERVRNAIHIINSRDGRAYKINQQLDQTIWVQHENLIKIYGILTGLMMQHVEKRPKTDCSIDNTCAIEFWFPVENENVEFRETIRKSILEKKLFDVTIKGGSSFNTKIELPPLYYWKEFYFLIDKRMPYKKIDTLLYALDGTKITLREELFMSSLTKNVDKPKSKFYK